MFVEYFGKTVTLTMKSSNNHITINHFEKYVFANQKPEIFTKYLLDKRNRNARKAVKRDYISRLCGVNIKNIFYIITSCPKSHHSVTY